MGQVLSSCCWNGSPDSEVYELSTHPPYDTPMEETPTTVKCVVVGDSGVGKTCLLICYTTNVFPRESVPTKFDSYTAELNLQGLPVQYSLWDTFGEDEYDQFRRLDYANADVFVVCFSVTDHTSFERVKTKWVPELKQHRPDTPMVLVGTKQDLQNDTDTLEKMKQNNLAPITAAQGAELAEEIGAVQYVETSALEKRGIRNAFDAGLSAGLEEQFSREGEGEEGPASVKEAN